VKWENSSGEQNLVNKNRLNTQGNGAGGRRSIGDGLEVANKSHPFDKSVSDFGLTIEPNSLYSYFTR
jgi:hypothetical protein